MSFFPRARICPAAQKKAIIEYYNSKNVVLTAAEQQLCVNGHINRIRNELRKIKEKLANAGENWQLITSLQHQYAEKAHELDHLGAVLFQSNCNF